ncbi:ubiquitin family protein [Robiginitomaculum antarcticum]|uniref:hypothetical protein n=1 Tax=Robiginitomaculum antarcticum TaxID=437507 RepID=UPI0003A9786B|nr:hypothetical protein [Robiginitomaculum antarcticum]
MFRASILTLIAIALAGSGLLLWYKSHSTFQDGTPDDRVLAAMQSIVWDADAALVETGVLPNILEDLSKVHNWPGSIEPDYPISYRGLNDSGIELCAEFENPSKGQDIARPFFDVMVGLHLDLSTSREKSGLYCYTINLVKPPDNERHDGLLYRELNAAATSLECSFSATSKLPSDDVDVQRFIDHNLAKNSCNIGKFVGKFIGKSGQQIRYSNISENTFQLCAEFKEAYSFADKPLPVFDPQQDSRFAEFIQERDEAGEFCFEIKMLRPEIPASEPLYQWEDYIDVQSYPIKQRASIKKDKRAIGDAVNVLRLVRCAYTIDGSVPVSIDQAIQTVAQSPNVAERYICGWIPSFYEAPYNSPVAKYEPIDDRQIRVCAQFENVWEQPLKIHFSGGAVKNWPTSLHELQKPIENPGRHCYAVSLTAIRSGE